MENLPIWEEGKIAGQGFRPDATTSPIYGPALAASACFGGDKPKI
jgi:hypothetical protein